MKKEIGICPKYSRNPDFSHIRGELLPEMESAK
jgi:hypothetical protein